MLTVMTSPFCALHMIPRHEGHGGARTGWQADDSDEGSGLASALKQRRRPSDPRRARSPLISRRTSWRRGRGGGQGRLQPRPRTGADRPLHACLHALPNPDPVSYQFRCRCSRSHGSAIALVFSEPGRAPMPPGFLGVQSCKVLCCSNRCARACSCDCVRVCCCGLRCVTGPTRSCERWTHAH